MYKQKQLPTCCLKRRYRCARHTKSLKKNRQILDTYVLSPSRIRQDSIYELVQRQRLQALRRKHQNKYVIINPNLKYYKNFKTEPQEELQDRYLEQLKTIKTQIRNLKRDFDQKKQTIVYPPIHQSIIQPPVYQQPQSLYQEIICQPSSCKSQCFHNCQSEHQSNRNHTYNSSYPSSIEINPVIHFSPQIVQKKGYHLNPEITVEKKSYNQNPQVVIEKRQYSRHPEIVIQRKKTPRQIYRRKAYSVNHKYESNLQQLKQQVQHLKRQITLDKLKNSISLSPIYGYDSYRQNPSNQRNVSLSRHFVGNSSNNIPNQRNMFNSRINISKNYNSNNRLDSIYVMNPKQKTQFDTQLSWKKQVKENAFRKVQKVVNAIFFTSYLRQFSQKIRLKRQNFFKDSFQQNIYHQISIIKSSFVKSTQQFIKNLPITEGRSLIIVSTDSEKQRLGKIQLTRKYLNYFLDFIGQSQFLPNMAQTLTQTCYYVCRHGGAGVTSNYFTAEQLDIMCISKNTLRISCQRHLEKSQILAFIWIKLIIFNILLRTESIQEFKIQNNTIWNCNMALIGSIIYQLSRRLQAEMLQKVPTNYVIGNWKHINFISSKNSHNKKAIVPCKSMVINLKPLLGTLKVQQSPNQLVQGTISKSYLSEAYQFQGWQTQERKIFNFVTFIHKKMCKYHANLKQTLI